MTDPIADIIGDYPVGLPTIEPVTAGPDDPATRRTLSPTRSDLYRGSMPRIRGCSSAIHAS